MAGRSGEVGYGAGDVLFEGLEGRLDTLRWTADAASVGKAWLRDDAGRIDVAVERLEMPRGLMLTRGAHGVEIVSPHVSLSEMKLTIKGPFERAPAAAAPAASMALVPQETAMVGLRQDKLRFLESLSGRINLTVKVRLDLPVVGMRTLDQQLRIPIQDGSLDFRKLEKSLDWLEGAFLDIKHGDHKLALTWKVPIVGSSRELIAWNLDDEASTMAAFGRVPVRSLADFRAAPAKPASDPGKRQTLRALTLDAIDIALSLVAPRSFEAAGGTIMFGGDDQPGMVDLKVTGSISDTRAGALRGSVGSIDTTLKDVRVGPLVVTADRLHFDGLDELEVVFDGFSPTCVTVVIHRVTATNLSLQIGSDPAP